MADFVDYDQLVLDFASALRSNVTGFRKVIEDANDFDYDFPNMPLADVGVIRNIPENTAGQTYYCTVVVTVKIAAFDMTSRREAAKIRNDLANAAQRYFQENPRFSGVVDSIQIGNAEFDTMENKDQGFHVAGALLEFHVKLYSDR